MEKNKDVKYLVRIAQTDVEGKKKILYALRKIKGIDIMFANMVCSVAEVNPDTLAGKLREQEIKKIEEIIFDPAKFGIPEWAFNRKKDPETGKSIHIITTTLKFTKENDIKQMRKIKSYRGMRHSFGLPVRGQKTKSNFRKSKGKAMGVQRKKKK